LEESLGVELFHRSQAGPARLVTTEAAQAALPDLRAGFDSLAAAMNRLRSSRERTSLSVTVSTAFADKWLLHRLDGFYRQHPKCELQIDTNTTLVDFSTQSVDVGIRYGAGVWPGVAAYPFARDEFFPVCAPALLEGRHALRTPEDLRAHPLIHDISLASIPAFCSWRDWNLAAGLDVPGSERGLRINDSAAAYRMAIAGQGVALGRTTLVAQDLREGRLVRPFGPVLECPLAYYLVCRPRDAEDPTIVALREWLIREADADRLSLEFSAASVPGACQPGSV
jgi:LysR family glycine cleavage system transcriptional activator